MEWRPVVGYEGHYEVSDTGLVRSLDRLVLGRYRSTTHHGKIRSTFREKYIILYRTGTYRLCKISYLVLISFDRLPKQDEIIGYKDGNTFNYDLKNLYWKQKGPVMSDKLFNKTCRVCGKVFPYDNQDELKEFFYKKDKWFLSTCKSCELEKHAKKYRDGKYGYSKDGHKKDDMRYIDDVYRQGNQHRC